MTSIISKFIIQTLCTYQGCLDFQSLNETMAQRFTVSDSVLRTVLFDDGKIVIRQGRRKASGSQIMSPDSLIVAKTSLRVCQRKPGECPGCDALHLCKFFVCGGCTYESKCRKPHSLTSQYNADLLKKHELHELTEKQLFQLLLQNDPFLLPEICSHYNKGNGVHGSCKYATSCTKLHICQHYVQGDCKFGSSCKRAHTFNAQGMKIFQGFSQENITNLNGLYRNKLIIMGQGASHVLVMPVVRQPTEKPDHSNPQPPTTITTTTTTTTATACPSKPISDADRNEICLYFIRLHCSFKEKCTRVHWHLPYRWQVSDGKTWRDLHNMEDIEKAYCDPEHNTSCMDQPAPTSGIFSLFGYQRSASPVGQFVDFITMTYEQSPVRRLSTASSISKPPHYILTTQWLWYWKDEKGKWIEYGQGESDSLASVTSQTLENVYLADRDTAIPFSAGKQQYVLHFKGESGSQQMYQENVKYKTKREVRRRPRFVSAHDVKMKADSSTSSQSSSSSTAESIPPHWNKNALPDFGYKLVLLSKSDKDHELITTLFKRTMTRSTITSIQRIQNPSLWKVFQWQEAQMKDRNSGQSVNKQYLFHGTDESLIEAICEQNFDWRMCGVHGTAYGKGSYFARDASYSDRYSRAKGNQNKIMFVALVLVGDYTTGSSSYVRPPSKGKALYDSCVDSKSNPSIYVVFEKQQIYPEYLINYI